MSRFKKPYLVMRATIRKDVEVKHPCFSEAISTGYMGSSEFEFGAMGKSLRAMHAANASGVPFFILSAPRGEGITHPITQQSLRVCGFYSEQEMQEYNKWLIMLSCDLVHTKERTDFSVHALREERLRPTDFWWDIENHVMWTFHKPTTHKLEDYLKASWLKMGLQVF